MAKTPEEYLIDFIQKKNDWTKITLQDVAEDQKVPLHVARNAISVIRYNKHIRYHFIDSRSRFKAKEYLYCDDVQEKVNDAKNISQFYLTTVEEEYLRKKLADYINEENIDTYYVLGSICEKLKIKGLDREWIVIKINEFSSLLNATSLEIIKYLDILIEKELLFKSPIQSAYKLTFSDEDVSRVKNEISELILENPDKIEVEQSLRPMSADMEEFEQIPEAQEMKDFLNQTINYNEKISQLLVEQLKVYEKLRLKEQVLQKQQRTFTALNNFYMESQENLENYKEKYKDLQEQMALMEAFDRKREAAVEEAIMIFKSRIMSIVENYISLPVHEKNKQTNNYKFKAEIMDEVFSMTNSISKQLAKKLED